MSVTQITKLKPYTTYKHSGVSWLRDIPEHWDVPRLKMYLLLNDSGVWGEEPDDKGTIVLRSTEQTVDGHWNIKNPAKLRIREKERDSATLVTGDLLITKSSGSNTHIGKTTIVDAEVSSLHCCFSNFMQRIRTGKNIRPKFLWYYFNNHSGREQLLTKATTTTGLANLNGQIIGNAQVPTPPADEQTAIVRYLDDADQRIRAYVSAKETLIALLEEERQALIQQAVTRGLDPNVRLKPSGVEWLGDVPEHWEVTRFAQQVSIAEGQVDPKIQPYASMLMIAPNHIESGTGRLLSRETASEQGAISGKYFCRAGDIVYSKIRPALAKVSVAPTDCLCSADMYPLNPRNSLQNDYLFWLLLSTGFTGWSTLQSDRVAMPKINRQTLNNIYIPLPPLSEQAFIVQHLIDATAKTSSAIDHARRQIDLMNEYRTRLIADVVTGKLDVRQAEKSTPKDL